MPLYTYTCPCGHTSEQINRVAERHTHAPEHCGARMGMRLHAPMIAVQAEVCARSPVDGTVLTTRRARIEHMKRNGLQEALPATEVIAGERKRWSANKALADQLPKLPEPLKEQLYREAA